MTAGQRRTPASNSSLSSKAWWRVPDGPSRFMWCSTISPRTRPRTSTTSSLSIRTSVSTSPQPIRPGSIQVELWFAKIQRDVIRRGVFTSVADLGQKASPLHSPLFQINEALFAGAIPIQPAESALTKSPGQLTRSVQTLRHWIKRNTRVVNKAAALLLGLMLRFLPKRTNKPGTDGRVLWGSGVRRLPTAVLLWLSQTWGRVLEVPLPASVGFRLADPERSQVPLIRRAAWGDGAKLSSPTLIIRRPEQCSRPLRPRI